MSLPRVRRGIKPRVTLATEPPRPWPVDPELGRRVIETSRRIGRTRTGTRLERISVLPRQRTCPARGRLRPAPGWPGIAAYPLS